MSVEASARVTGSLPHDVRLSPLVPHRDERGSFVELFREEWETDVHPVQWNAVDSEQGVLRGVHVHPRHDDYLTVVRGSATVGLRDLRDDSPTAGAAAFEAALFDTGAALTFGGLTYAAGRLAQWRLDQVRCEQWGREWDQAGPQWGRKAT